MSFDDWKNYFETCEICILSPTIKNITDKVIINLIYVSLNLYIL